MMVMNRAPYCRLFQVVSMADWVVPSGCRLPAEGVLSQRL